MTTKTIVIAIAATFLAALLFGQASGTSQQHEWEMVSPHITSYASGGSSIAAGNWAEAAMYLYNKRTGKVYLRFTNCSQGGVQLDGGCFGSIAVFADDAGVTVTPSPTTHESDVSPY